MNDFKKGDFISNLRVTKVRLLLGESTNEGKEKLLKVCKASGGFTFSGKWFLNKNNYRLATNKKITEFLKECRKVHPEVFIRYKHILRQGLLNYNE